MHDETNPDPSGGACLRPVRSPASTKQSPRYDHETNPNLTREWGQGVPAERPSEPLESDLSATATALRFAADLYIPGTPEICPPSPSASVRRRERAKPRASYAQTLAERGFLTVAFDPSLPAKAAANPVTSLSPDINTEDFSAAVDYLRRATTGPLERIGILGICGFGGAINAAAIDTRIKATVASTMYDIAAARRTDISTRWMPTHATNSAGSSTPSARKTRRRAPARWPAGVVDPLPDDAPRFVKDYYAYYYKTRSRLPSSFAQLERRLEQDFVAVVHQHAHPCRTDEIRSAVLLIHGEKAHSRYFSEDAFKKLKGKTRNYILFPAPAMGSVRQLAVIPFDKIEGFSGSI